jgi:hypothetical protein
MVPTRSVLSKSETLDRGHAVSCFFRACDNALAGKDGVRGDDGSLDPLSVNVNSESDPVCRITVREVVVPVQSNIELSASNRFHERRRAQVAVFGCVFSERRAIHADRDGRTREAVGVHPGRCDVVMALVLVLVGVWWVGEIEEVSSEAKGQAGAL